MSESREKKLKFYFYFKAVLLFVFCIFLWNNSLKPILNSIEYKLYDYRVTKSLENKASKDIVLLSVDDYSLDLLSKYKGLGASRWPWARSNWASVINFVNRGNPKVIIFDILFMGEEGVHYKNILSDNALANALKENDKILLAFLLTNLRKDLISETDKVYEDNNRLDNFIKKEYSFFTKPIKSSLGLELTDSLSDKNFSDFDVKKTIDNITFYTYMPLHKPFMESAAGIGVINLNQTEDGIARFHTPLYKLVTNDSIHYLPSLSLAAVLKVLPDEEKKPFRIEKNRIVLGKRIIPIDNEGKFHINWHGPGGTSGGTYNYIPAAKVLLSDAYKKGKISKLNSELKIGPEVFQDKIVVIGVSASDIDIFATPFEMNFPGPEIVATAIDNILNDTLTSGPNNHKLLREAPFYVNFLILFLFCSAIAVFNIKVSHVYLNIQWFILVIILFILFSFVSFIHFKYWTNMVYPLLFIGLTAIGSYLYKNYQANKHKKEIEMLFGKFVSPQVLEKLLNDPKNINREGQRKRMTVLFSDIRGFTTLAEVLDAKELISQLEEYFNVMVEIILENGGTVDKFIGDALMAFWGDPLPYEDHALRAVKAAVSMQAASAELNKKWVKENKPPLNVGIGINTGEMVVGHYGSKKLISYTVMGDSVNLAARIERLNKQYDTLIIITEETLKDVYENVNVEFLDEVEVMGKTQLVKIYSVKSLEK